ncbi:RNA pseudouridine synthase [Paenibacillus selenitireducens]|uniref:Pseudouridine synthase n=1 Tax=Paenibacillus selenitireducens TaxID=1324314 RepID=A0A1T2XB66_9BACL|nr:RluA family pseudouridine synthase [Paenibacillus selenitireducens]OPA76853.1 RNA pseudouridine synthase [Paenibacillus selenitireducens]
MNKKPPKFRKKAPAPPKPRPGKHAPIPPKTYEVKEATELLAFLLTHMTQEGRNAIKSVLSRGQVSVNDKVVTLYNHPLQPGQTVTIRKEKPIELPPLIGLRIIHEDEDILVIEKEAGLLSVATPQENEMTAYRQLTAYVRAKDADNRIFVVHRLDRDTSGVMMFAKSEKVQQIMQNAWKEMVEERLYVALVEGKVKQQEGTISSWLKENKAMKMYSSKYPNDGQHAVTHYNVMQSNRQYSLLEVHLDTGRKNQIRVHMQDIGHPIAGDKKYGAQTKPIGRLGLHARVLSFTHPTTGEALRFETSIPKPFLNFSKGDAPNV